jgi:hypothetical protein
MARKRAPHITSVAGVSIHNLHEMASTIFLSLLFSCLTFVNADTMWFAELSVILQSSST